mgnify:CR=1 FL=1
MIPFLGEALVVFVTFLKNHIKLIRSGKSKKTGALRFYEEMIRIPEGKNADSVVKDLLSK